MEIPFFVNSDDEAFYFLIRPVLLLLPPLRDRARVHVG